VLTKPIGTQVVVNAYEWLTVKTHNFEKIKHLITPEEVHEIFLSA